MKDIGILNLTRFGDLVQTTPVLLGLRKRHPGAKLHLIVKSRFRSVAEMLPAVDVIHEVDGHTITQILVDPGVPFLDRFCAIRKVVDRLCETHFDVCLNLTHSRASAVLISLLNTDRIVGFTLDRNGQRRVDNQWLGHMATLVRSRRLARFNLVEMYLGAAGLVGSGEPVCVRIPDESRAFAAERLTGPGPLLAVQLGASTDTKTWSVERFAETLQELARRVPSLRVVLVGVAAEELQAQQLKWACPGVRFEDLVGKTRVDELAAVLERVDLLLTGDTGTMHLAGAVGTQTCAVFVGLGTPHETAVYAEGHWAVMSRIACAPCAHFVECGHTVCHRDIPPEWLADLLQRILEKRTVDDIPPLPRADLLRTRFGEDGLIELVPVHTRRPEPQELLAGAYRAVFLESFEGVPARPDRIWRQAREYFGVEPQEWRAMLPETLPGQLERLDELGRRAEETASRLGDLAARPTALREAGKTLHETDEAIYSIARSEPLLAPLGLALEVDLEELPEADLPTVASLGIRHYGSLRRRVAVLRELIGARTALTDPPQGGEP